MIQYRPFFPLAHMNTHIANQFTLFFLLKSQRNLDVVTDARPHDAPNGISDAKTVGISDAEALGIANSSSVGHANFGHGLDAH